MNDRPEFDQSMEMLGWMLIYAVCVACIGLVAIACWY